MPFHPLLVVGFLAHISSSATYIWSTLKGRTQPNRVTFFMWSVAPFILPVCTFATIAFPLYFIGICAVVLFAIYRKRLIKLLNIW